MPLTVPDRFHNVSLAGNTAGVLAEVGSGTLTLAGGNNITLSQAGNAITISGAAAGGAFSGGDSNIGNTSGDTGVVTGRMVLAGGNNITLSGSTNGGSITITISGPNAAGAQTGISGLANSETTYTSGSVTLSALGAITIRSTTGQHFQFSVNAQTVESNTVGMSNIGNTAGDTAIRSAAQLQIVLAGGNNITLSQSTNGSSATITISAFNQTSPVVGNALQSVSSATDSGTQTSQFAAADHKHAGVGPLGVSNIGNTSGDTGTQYGRVVLAGGNNITLSVSSSNNGAQTITISGAAGGGAGYTAGLSNIGNTSGDTGVVTGRLVLAGGNNITLSGSTNGGSMTITVSAFNQTVESNTIGMSNIGNTSGDTAIRSAAQLQIVLAGGDNITLSQSTNGSSATITISQNSPAVGWLEYPPGWGRHQVQTLGNASLVVWPITVSWPITAHSMFWVINGTGASGSTAGVTIPIGIYTQMTGASSSRISLASSTQFTSSWTSGTNQNSDWGGIFGIRRWNVAFNVTLTPGPYWVGMGLRSTNAGTFSFGVHGSNIMSGVLGSNDLTRQFFPFGGAYNTTTLTAPNSIGSSELPMGGNARAFPWVAFGNTNTFNFGV